MLHKSLNRCHHHLEKKVYSKIQISNPNKKEEKLFKILNIFIYKKIHEDTKM